jgi:hypothetical protein
MQVNGRVPNVAFGAVSVRMEIAGEKLTGVKADLTPKHVLGAIKGLPVDHYVASNSKSAIILGEPKEKSILETAKAKFREWGVAFKEIDEHKHEEYKKAETENSSWVFV